VLSPFCSSIAEFLGSIHNVLMCTSGRRSQWHHRWLSASADLCSRLEWQRKNIIL